MINHVWIQRDLTRKSNKESCLSFPDKCVRKTRWYRIKVTYLDELLHPQEMRLLGLAAYIVQHECDHLDGITI